MKATKAFQSAAELAATLVECIKELIQNGFNARLSRSGGSIIIFDATPRDERTVKDLMPKPLEDSGYRVSWQDARRLPDGSLIPEMILIACATPESTETMKARATAWASAATHLWSAEE
jgi:hypothetical protein